MGDYGSWWLFGFFWWVFGEYLGYCRDSGLRINFVFKYGWVNVVWFN